MWMTDYVRAVKKAMMQEYGFPALPHSLPDDPSFEAPDGDYTVTIEGAPHRVSIVNGYFKFRGEDDHGHS